MTPTRPASSPCPQCRGLKIVRVTYPGIRRDGQIVCAVCGGKGEVETRVRPVRRIVSEGPSPD